MSSRFLTAFALLVLVACGPIPSDRSTTLTDEDRFEDLCARYTEARAFWSSQREECGGLEAYDKPYSRERCTLNADVCSEQDVQEIEQIINCMNEPACPADGRDRGDAWSAKFSCCMLDPTTGGQTDLPGSPGCFDALRPYSPGLLHMCPMGD